MKEIFEKIKNNPLFNGIEYGDFEKLFNCIGAHTQSFKKDEIILMAGDKVNYIGLMLSGSARIIKEDINGGVMLLAEIKKSELFAEALACAGVEHSPVTVQAAQDSEILIINFRRIISLCSSACTFHAKLIENMLGIIAQKNLMLNQKIDILSKRSTREKLLTFFDMQRGTANEFTVPYNREEMAHYLCVNRSAMSSELCKMRDEGLIEFNKNKFIVI